MTMSETAAINDNETQKNIAELQAYLKRGFDAPDLSYKKNALRTDYDIESVHEAFTLASINEHSMSFIMFGDEQFDDLSDDDILQQMRRFASSSTNMELLGINDVDDLTYHLYRFNVGNDDDRHKLSTLVQKMITCIHLPHDKKYATENGLQLSFAEYCGWNSFRYDLVLLILVKLFCNKIASDQFRPAALRKLSNLIIKFDDKPYRFASYVEQEMRANPSDFADVVIKASEYKTAYHTALWSDGHIDWAKIAKSSDAGGDEEEQKFPPSLKKSMAKSGLDIIIDELVALDKPHVWSSHEKLHLVEYNFNDVLGQRTESKNAIIQGQLRTLDKVRDKYPYTSAKFTSYSDLNRYTPAERDTTAATLAGLVLIGPNRIKPKDWDVVQYRFPVPDGDDEQFVDLLEYIKTKEQFVPDEFVTFFEHFRYKNTQRSYDNWKIATEQPISKKAVMLLPYYKDSQPIDCCITVSTGGAHGFIYAGLSRKTSSEIHAIMRASTGPSKYEKPTVDVDNVLHIDWSSFYPMMASKMQIYMTTEGIDRYSGIMIDRFAEKAKAGELWERYKNRLHPEYVQAEEDQMGSKFVLNNATGAGNTHKPYALLPLDNKTLSMRLIGNMLIWALAQRLAQAGAFILSTNTDGLYVCNISRERAQEIIDGYVKDYGMPVDPEDMARFINRDTSNRVEFEHRPDTITGVGGRLRAGVQLFYVDTLLGKSIPYPLIAGNAALKYMRDTPNWLTAPYDRSILEDYIASVAKDSSLSQPWYIVTSNSASNKLTIDGKTQQHVNRVILTKSGSKLANLKNSSLTGVEAVSMWNQYVDGERDTNAFISPVTNEPYQFDNNFVENSVKMDLCFARKLGASEQKALKSVSDYLPVYFGNDHLDADSLKEIKKNANAKSLVLCYGVGPIYTPVKRWKSNKLSGFTGETGKVVNRMEDLRHIDHDDLDLKAYTDWAESLLDNWKVTADLDALGMQFTPEAHITQSGVKKLSNDMLIISSLYQLE